MYKLVWSEYLIYLSLYYAISLVYRHGMSEDQMKAVKIGQTEFSFAKNTQRERGASSLHFSPARL